MAVPKIFTAGERLFADDLNDNFIELDRRGINFETLSFVESDFIEPNILPNVDNGRRWSFKRKMEGPETLAAPSNMPEGSVANIFVDPMSDETDSPSVRSRATGSLTSAAATSHPITLPGTTEAGDLLVLVFTTPLTAGNLLTLGNTGWVRNLQFELVNNMRIAIFSKINDGDNSLTITSAASTFSAHATLAISGVSGLPSVVFSGAKNGSIANSTHFEAELPLEDSRGRLWIATRVGRGVVAPTAQPSGYIGFQSVVSGGTSSTGANVAIAEKSTDGTTNSETPGSWTSVSSQWITAVIGIDASGPHTLSYSSEYSGEKPEVTAASLLQVVKLPDNKYAAVRSWVES